MIELKDEEQIGAMRRAGRVLRDVLALLEERAKPGIDSLALDKLAFEYIDKAGGAPSFLNYEGYPASACISFDDEIVHGIPSRSRVIEDGMLVKFDCGVSMRGMHTDAARTVCVGNVSEDKRRLAETAELCFFEAMKVVRAGARLGDLGNAIQAFAESRGYGVVRDLVGHGIGAEVHEEPDVPNFGKPGRGMRLYANMTVAVEPMLALGGPEIRILPDGWTAVTADGTPSAHYENTIVVREDGPEILTL